MLCIFNFPPEPGPQRDCSGLFAIVGSFRRESGLKSQLTEDNIYRIDYSRLKQIGLEYPSNPMIFGNNAGQLSYYNDAPHPDDLREIAIYTFTGR